MNQLSTQLYNGRYWLLFFLAVGLFLLVPEVLAQAANPLADIKIAPDGNNKDISSQFKFFIKLALIAVVFVGIIFAFGDALASVFTALREARRDGEWGKFVGQLMMILIGIAIVILIGSVMFEILSKFDDAWKF